MKHKISKHKEYVYIPDILRTKILKLLMTTKGYPEVRYYNYVKIVGTIYNKCIIENQSAYSPYPLAKEYWLKVIGGKYKTYLDELIDSQIVVKIKKRRSWSYKISFDIIITPNKLIRVKLATVKPQQSKNVQGISDIEINRIENRLGKRILKHLNQITVDYEAFEYSIKNGLLDINPDDFLIDITAFPDEMSFKGVIHYPNAIQSHNYKIKTLIKKTKELNFHAYYDKDRIRVISSEFFKRIKNNNFRTHARLNLLKLKNSDFQLSRDADKTRRVFHVGVFLPNRALQFVKIDGQDVVGIDAKTSQFLLLANLFNSFISNGDSIADNFSGKRKTFVKNLYKIFKSISNSKYNDVKLFYNDVLEDDFYDVVRKELNLDYRNQSKIFCFSIIFSKPNTKNEFKQIIRSRYPVVIDTLDSFKEEYGYKELSIGLQALESEVFIDGIFNELHKCDIKCFTRHDSVVVGKRNMNNALKIAKKYFIKLGLKSKFKIEKYSAQYISDLPNELEFLYEIDNEDDVNNLDLEELYLLLEEGRNILSEDDYNHIESRINEIRNYLPLDDSTIKLLYDLVTQIIYQYEE